MLAALAAPAAGLRPLEARGASRLQGAHVARPLARSGPAVTASLGVSGKGNDRPERPGRPHALPSALGAETPVGAEHGEGFLQFRLSGERTRLDVDALNEALRVGGAARIRHATMRPDEAYGLIFALDNVLFDTRALERAAWAAVAAARGLRLPQPERPALFGLAPARAAAELLRWTAEPREAAAIAHDVGEAYRAALLAPGVAPRPGVRAWLEAVERAKMPTALVTSLDRGAAAALLDAAGLRRFFGALVTAEDDMETRAQRLLSAAIKLGRPPERCVAFVGCPSYVTAAHNCTMRAVALMSPHTAPQLAGADLAIAAMDELSVYNVRRLFANAGSEFMDLRKQRVSERDARRPRPSAAALEGPPP